MRACNRILAILVISLACTPALADLAKLDAELRHTMETHAAGGLNPLARALSASPQVAATVRFSGDGLEAMKARGVVVRSVLGDVATVLIPVDRLAEIAALPEIHKLEAPRRAVPRLDKSVAYTRADQLRAGALASGWVGGTGKGVLVGIIDSGIDIKHGDFLDANGNTRIVRMWNMRSGLTGATPPKGADGVTPLYGAECDTAAINAAMAAPASLTNNCNPNDIDSHGTHVAGIAAGNGRGTGNGQAAGRFIGMAPEAGLLVANILDKNVPTTSSDPLLDAIAWMAGVARQLKKPLVINLSLGSYFGTRDGTGMLERAIDNVSGPGVIIVAAAGNEGNAPIRTELAPMTAGQIVQIPFAVPTGRTAEQLEFWSNGDNQYAVSLTCPDGSQTAWVSAGGSINNVNATCGQISITSAAPNTSNGDRQYYIGLANGSSTGLVSGAWILNIRADAVPVSESLGVVCGEDASGLQFTGSFVQTPTRGIVTGTGSARRAITVAAINTNYVWNTAAGVNTAPSNGPLGDISDFSSRGPRRVCSGNIKYVDVTTPGGQQNLRECQNPVMKPDIAAPGSFIMSSLSSAKANPAATDIEADGVHIAYMGTSMATPHVTGAVALLFQVNPNLTPEDAKRILFTTVQGNTYTQAASLPIFSSGVDMPPAPNYAWGYGAMDAAKAVRMASGNIFAPGWNLAGNTLTTPVDVAAVFGAPAIQSSIVTIWKWVPAASVWAFYAPALAAQGGTALQDYATAKGYQLLTTINPGEGFWVNAKPATGLTQVVVPALGGMAFNYNPASLTKGWNLVATGPSVPPADFNTLAMASGKTLSTVWAWNAESARWYFYAPALAAQGGAVLGNYVTSKGYLDFTSTNKTLGAGAGFWVNNPTP